MFLPFSAELWKMPVTAAEARRNPTAYAEGKPAAKLASGQNHPQTEPDSDFSNDDREESVWYLVWTLLYRNQRIQLDFDSMASMDFIAPTSMFP